MEKKLKVGEILECINQLRGGQFGEIKLAGFCNEKSISEGVRRIANKTAKKLVENYPGEQFQSIYNLQLTDLKIDIEVSFGSEEDEKKYLDKVKNEKIKELFESEVVINFEELPDWKVMNDRLEAKNENLSHNYVYLFEKLFLNYD